MGAEPQRGFWHIVGTRVGLLSEISGGERGKKKKKRKQPRERKAGQGREVVAGAVQPGQGCRGHTHSPGVELSVVSSNIRDGQQGH